MTDRNGNLPIASIALASLAALALILLDVHPLIALAVLIIWIGSLWLIGGKAPVTEAPVVEEPLATGRMAELIEFSGTPVLIVEGGRIEVANRAARKLLGKHILGQDARVALRHPEAIALLDSKKKGFAHVRGLVRRQDMWRINRQPYGDGTSIIELQNETAEVDISRAHTDFVANASHELRTPLASIIGYVETLRDDDTLDPEVKSKFLDTIMSEAERLQSLVSDLMSLSRIEAEKHEQPQQKVELADLIARSSRDVAGIKREKRLEFTLDESLKARGDQRQLEQLVRNLVDNALKYGAPDSKVSISLDRTENNEARLQVVDHGEGIDPEHIPHLTRRFYRTDPGRSRASGGTGLGLAIVKHIVERHLGRLDIASEVGTGTTVTVRLPLTADDKSPSAE